MTGTPHVERSRDGLPGENLTALPAEPGVYLLLLRSDLRAERAYIAVYGVTEEFSVEYRVINVLEATKTGVVLSLQHLHGIGRSSWLQMENNIRGTSSLFADNLTKAYGMELYDEQGMPIGYLGIEKTQENVFAEQDIQLLRETAEVVSAAIVKPLKQFKE
ncbi:hypothetical protein U27_05581 [Candidatus Vecturithrix granuli]|uniref:GAF domain-containing protein n=1 Tax=Vecturithrix granuli TaxID=1499967 RepID=A0A081C202_VECG1|nr:hypothetical protein U27_05581 [Candidatus Vecturithrix granuli]